jgi:ABC-type uncharacterized transport system auxiliary subunit
VVLLSLCGCLSTTSRTPPRVTYVLSASRPCLTATGAVSRAVLRVNAFRAAPDAEQVGLAARLDEVRRQRSSRHVFVAAPAALVVAQTRQWLAAAGLGAWVVDAGSAVSSTFDLDGMLNEIGADLRDPAHPRAVLDLQVALLDTASPGYAPVFQRAYRREVPLADAAPATVVRGLNMALAQLLAALEEDLRGAAALTRDAAGPPAR